MSQKHNPSSPGTSSPASKPGVRIVRGVAVADRVLTEEQGPGHSLMRDQLAPIALLIIGIIGRIIEVVALRDDRISLPAGLVWATLGLVLATFGVVAGVLAIATFMGSEIERPGPMVRKCAAAAVFALTVGALLASFDKEPGHIRGMLVAVHAILLLWFFIIAYLLRLDLLEALVATAIAIGIHVVIMLVIGQLVAERVSRMIFY